MSGSAYERLQAGSQGEMSMRAARKVRTYVADIQRHLSSLGAASVDELLTKLEGDMVLSDNVAPVLAALRRLQDMASPVSFEGTKHIRSFDVAWPCSNLMALDSDTFIMTADAGENRGFIQAWDTKGHELAHSPVFTNLLAYGATDDGQVVVKFQVGSITEVFGLWNPKDGFMNRLPIEQKTGENCTVHEGRIVLFPALSAQQDRISVWSGSMQEAQEYQLPVRQEGVRFEGLTPDGNMILSYKEGKKRTFEVVHPEDNAVVATYQGSENLLWLTGMFADGALLFSRGSLSRRPYLLWDLKDPAQPVLPVFPDFVVNFANVTMHPYDPRYLLVNTINDGRDTVEIFDRSTLSLLPSIPVATYDKSANSRLGGMTVTESGHIIVHWGNSVHVYGREP